MKRTANGNATSPRPVVVPIRAYESLTDICSEQGEGRVNSDRSARSSWN